MVRPDPDLPNREPLNFRRPATVSLSLVKSFVHKAKLKGFAATDQKTTLPDQTSVYSYRGFADPGFEGMIYADLYSGNTIETGHESVSIDLVLRWRNQYYGGTTEKFWDASSNSHAHEHLMLSLVDTGPRFPEVVSAFLKRALLDTPEEFPVRGPEEYSAGEVAFEGELYEAEWVYTNDWSPVALFTTADPFAAFRGQERILVNGIEVYWHGYHGGIVRDKYFPVNLKP